MATILSSEDLKKITGYTQTVAQRRVLDELGIPYKTVGNQTIVHEAHVAAWIEGRPVPRIIAPDFSAVT